MPSRKKSLYPIFSHSVVSRASCVCFVKSRHIYSLRVLIFGSVCGLLWCTLQLWSSVTLATVMCGWEGELEIS